MSSAQCIFEEQAYRRFDIMININDVLTDQHIMQKNDYSIIIVINNPS